VNRIAALPIRQRLNEGGAMETGITNEFEDTSSESSTRDQGSSSTFVVLTVCRVILSLVLATGSPLVELVTGDWNWASYEPWIIE